MTGNNNAISMYSENHRRVGLHAFQLSGMSELSVTSLYFSFSSDMLFIVCLSFLSAIEAVSLLLKRMRFEICRFPFTNCVHGFRRVQCSEFFRDIKCVFSQALIS